MLRHRSPGTLVFMRALLLWDIDHTLIESRGVGRAIYERVFPVATGQELRGLAAVHGRTEFDISSETLQQHGIEPTDQAVGDVAKALADGYRAAAAELARRGRALPGARQALETTSAMAGVQQSVLTGNTAAVARAKLDVFGLSPFLDVAAGAYGDDHRDRAELVGIARARAEQRLGATIPVDRVVLVGDTPADVDAARTAGAHSIAIASGEYTTDDLRVAGASVVLRELERAEFQRALDLVHPRASA